MEGEEGIAVSGVRESEDGRTLRGRRRMLRYRCDWGERIRNVFSETWRVQCDEGRNGSLEARRTGKPKS